jgi:hypothetical protein
MHLKLGNPTVTICSQHRMIQWFILSSILMAIDPWLNTQLVHDLCNIPLTTNRMRNATTQTLNLVLTSYCNAPSIQLSYVRNINRNGYQFGLGTMVGRYKVAQGLTECITDTGSLVEGSLFKEHGGSFLSMIDCEKLSCKISL